MLPDFVKQVIEDDSICYFTTAIDDSIQCSKDANCDFNGFTINPCKHYPCLRIKELNLKYNI